MVGRGNASRAVLVTLSLFIMAGPMAVSAASERSEETTGAATLQLRKAGEPGDPLIVTGRIVDGAGRPVPGATLSVYHADAHGAYSRPRLLQPPADASPPRLSGTLKVGANGAYRIETVVPSQIRNLEGGLPHIHGMVSAPGRGDAGFVINLTLDRGRHDDARQRAAAGDRRSMQRTIHRDRNGTWWLVYDPTPGIRL